MRIAFAGNPNSGKTTMYNALTGRNEKVGNWAGVTVDKKEAQVRKSYTDGLEVIAVDLPGVYSMSAFTSEESVTNEYIQKGGFDVIVNIVDATNLSRSLFFTTQLLELGIPTVIALNKTDINQKKQTKIDTEKLSAQRCSMTVSFMSICTCLRDIHSALWLLMKTATHSQLRMYVTRVSSSVQTVQRA